MYTPVRLHLHMQDPQCRGYSSPAVDTHPCSHSSHHSHPLAQRRICQCCHPAHPVRKQHRGPVRSVLCRMIRCNFPYSDRRQDERRNIPYRCVTQNIPLRGHKSHIMVTGCNRCTQPIVPCYTASVFCDMVAVQVIINRFELLNIQQKNSIPNIFIMGTVIPIRYRINCGVIGKINTGCVDITCRILRMGNDRSCFTCSNSLPAPSERKLDERKPSFWSYAAVLG